MEPTSFVSLLSGRGVHCWPAGTPRSHPEGGAEALNAETKLLGVAARRTHTWSPGATQ